MDYTITVDYGISDYEIVNRKNGKADLVVGGTYLSYKDYEQKNEMGADGDRIYVRILDENTGIPVVPWVKAELLPNCKWEAKIYDVPEGGLYQLETKNKVKGKDWIEGGSTGQIVSHFGVGDIYIIAGQSNASGTGMGIGDDGPMLGVANLKSGEKWELAVHPLKDKHSPFLAFAKKVYKYTGIPIGLVNCAVGGSEIARWLPEQNGTLYNRMMSIAKEKDISPNAILFYQGCSDAGNPNYETELKSLVEHMRKDFNNDKLPIYMFQLNAHYNAGKDDDYSDSWDEVREIQRQMPKYYDNLYVIPTIGIPMSDGIHNSRSGNIILGERLADYLLKYSFGKKIYAIAPELDSVSVEKDKTICIRYKGVYSDMAGHFTDGNDIYRVEDSVGRIEISKVVTEYDTISLTLSREPVGAVYVSCQSGVENRQNLMEISTSVPPLVFFKVKAEIR